MYLIFYNLKFQEQIYFVNTTTHFLNVFLNVMNLYLPKNNTYL